MQQLVKEEKASVVPAVAAQAAEAERAKDAYDLRLRFLHNHSSRVQVQIAEKVWVALDRDGTLASLELKGELSITIVDPDHVCSLKIISTLLLLVIICIIVIIFAIVEICCVSYQRWK
jgi:hypothetical protein